MSTSKRIAVAITVGVISSIAIGGCGSIFDFCYANAEEAILLNYRNQSGDRVEPDEVVVVHEETGDEESAQVHCSDELRGGHYETSGTFNIRARCGSETLERTVEVEGGECGPNPETVTLTFPDGACETCPLGEFGMEDAGGLEDGSDAGGFSTTDASSGGTS